MRWQLILLISLVILSSALGEVNVEHSFGTFEEGENIVISVVIEPDSKLKQFDIAEMIPVDWEIQDWEIKGYDSKISYEITCSNQCKH